jgi:Ala-tRNA(Pro) deacylase
MAVSASVQEFLRRANIRYAVFAHVPAFTARDEAAAMAVPEPDWAKTVICFADGEPIQAVVPADLEVDLERLRKLAGAESLRLAHEDELQWLFPDCELGAMPPFGPLYRQQVFVDKALAYEDEVVFNAGTHRDAICMRFEDFVAITRPVVGQIARIAVQ